MTTTNWILYFLVATTIIFLIYKISRDQTNSRRNKTALFMILVFAWLPIVTMGVQFILLKFPEFMQYKISIFLVLGFVGIAILEIASRLLTKD